MANLQQLLQTDNFKQRRTKINANFDALNNEIVRGLVAKLVDAAVPVSPSDLLLVTPDEQANYEILIYGRVITAETNVILTVSWSDGSGQQSETLMSHPVGVGYFELSRFKNATNASDIIVNASASVANQVFLSVSIVKH